MKYSGFKATLVALAMVACGSANADFGVGLKAGTLGLGIEGRWAPIELIDFRVGMNNYDYDTDESTSGIDYDATLALDSYYVTGNLNFPLSPLRLTAGAFANNNEVQASSKDTGGQDIVLGGVTYPADVVGTVSGAATFDDFAPYVGVGFDFEPFDKFGLNLDIGVLWQGEPGIALSADGTGVGDPAFDAALEAERQELEDDLSDYKAWPVISLSFIYNF